MWALSHKCHIPLHKMVLALSPCRKFDIVHVYAHFGLYAKELSIPFVVYVLAVEDLLPPAVKDSK